jgi:D-serine dehydratase
MLPDGLDLRVGDRVVLGISHPCTAFDKWKLIYVVDDLENVVDGVMTFF